MGNGLGGGGTSVPYFLQNRIRNVVTMENEYARILLELGLPGLVMWGMFLIWVVHPTDTSAARDMFYFGRRLAYVACACSFALGLIGVGLFTSVPGNHADVPADRLVRRPGGANWALVMPADTRALGLVSAPGAAAQSRGKSCRLRLGGGRRD